MSAICAAIRRLSCGTRLVRCVSAAESLFELLGLQWPTCLSILCAGGDPVMISQKPDATMDPADEVMTAPVAAALKGVHRNSVHNAIKDGRLKATRSGKSWLIRRRDLDAWQVLGHRPKNGGDGSGRAATATPPSLPAEQRERARKLKRLLAEWMADESGHDD